ncbi:MAG: flavin reductase [Candidatus Omnitrophica bacterium]|nr:flavin reductase [Candidatus Omnitrophota bacterium]
MSGRLTWRRWPGCWPLTFGGFPVDPEAKKKALRKILHGVCVIGVKEGDRLNAFTATWISQVSFQPPLVVLAVRKDSLSYSMIEASKVFVINLLGAGEKPLAQHFLKPGHLGGDKFQGVRYRLGKVGAPILEEGIAFVECEVRRIDPGGDHAVVIGEVVEAGVHRDAEPLSLKETGWQYGG